jgi:hypothetical protein
MYIYLYPYICVYIYIYIYICICICMHIYTCVNICIHISTLGRCPQSISANYSQKNGTVNSKRIPSGIEAPLEITENIAKPLNLSDDFARQKLAKIAVMNANNSNSFLSPLIGNSFETSQRYIYIC